MVSVAGCFLELRDWTLSKSSIPKPQVYYSRESNQNPTIKYFHVSRFSLLWTGPKYTRVRTGYPGLHGYRVSEFLISNIRPGEVAAYFTYAGGICRTLISAGAALCIEIKLGQDRKSAGDHNPRKQEFNRIPKKMIIDWLRLAWNQPTKLKRYTKNPAWVFIARSHPFSIQ